MSTSFRPRGVFEMSISTHRANSLELLNQAFEIRHQVFILEQQVPADLERDEYDDSPETLHFFARDTESGEIVGTARMRPYTPSVGKVERVAVLLKFRKMGIGQLLMARLEKEAKSLGWHKLKLNAQTHAQHFYERLGYHAVGEVFLEAGIEHISMSRDLTPIEFE
jgi:predicted GNAT family N-acyltransferase